MLELGRGHTLVDSLTQSKPLQPLHYLWWGLMGTVTVEFCSVGWSGWAVQLVITHGRDLLQEKGKFSCVAVFVDLLWEAVQAWSMHTSRQLTPVPTESPKYTQLAKLTSTLL